ncbi:hypothetical protein J3A83DRAFT_4190200 [Scleroderma citrinum]
MTSWMLLLLVLLNIIQSSEHGTDIKPWSVCHAAFGHLSISSCHTMLVVDVAALQCLCGCTAVAGGATGSGSMLLGWQMKTRPMMKSWKVNTLTGLCSTEPSTSLSCKQDKTHL